MLAEPWGRLAVCGLWLVAGLVLPALVAGAQGNAPRVTLHVSKLGDDSDGLSWRTGFHTIQRALDAVPPGGRVRIVIRPDTYFEANLHPAHRGEAGAYNELVGDTDGKLGSGTTGSVIIDSGDPGQKGFKSYDWWGAIRATSKGWSPQHTEETFSAIGWDRWRVRRLYVTGGDGGLFFDLTDQVKPFTVEVEDCVGIGRAFGGGVASCLSRPEEPIAFRRCTLWCLDRWGDAAAAYVRVENAALPTRPDVIFDDCTLVGPECALKSSNYGFHTFSRIRLTRCSLFALNFSQPQGTPSAGVIQSVQAGKLLYVELEDCLVAGYRVFGVLVEKETVREIGYTTRGSCLAYVQFQQDVPPGFHRIGHWPADRFSSIAPPLPARRAQEWQTELVRRDLCELSPFVWKGRLCHMECVRPASGGQSSDYWLRFVDAADGKEIGRGAEGHGLAAIIVHRGTAHVFASRWDGGSWRDVTHWWSRDLASWRSEIVVKGDGEELFNTSVCRSPEGFVLAYESNDPAYPAFTIKFARSRDLRKWQPDPLAVFGRNRYAACPCIRASGGWYYLLYLEHRTPRHFYETYIARSRDLRQWELSSANPVLTPSALDEGVNASDPELVEYGGQTFLYYAVGDQLTWMNVKRIRVGGRLAGFLRSWFREPGVPDAGSRPAAR